MTLAVGSRLGPYEILSPIGAGGMGEVYKARDTRLDRTVAVKVLPEHLSKDEELRQRFEREAKAISSLSHPHVCALHDVGREGDVDYLVMELLEGETLSDRLARGSLPTEQVLRFGAELADALDSAHRQGLVHRDLKPGNVMLTKSGVKVLDFGLARAAEPIRGASGLTSLPTMAGNLTQEGTILGTFQYMAPEQLEGRPTDARTDLFALGAVLYEMATGKKAFSGQSQASLIAAILEKEPAPISSFQPLTPPGLDRAIRTSLAKDPEDRWQNARDLANELRWIAQAGSQAGTPAPTIARRKTRERVWMGAALALLASTAALFWLWRHPSVAEAPVLRLSIAPPEKSSVMGTLAVSPDGRRIAFVAKDASGTARLWIRPFDTRVATPMVGTEGASHPFWSPDGRYIAFAAEGKLRKVALSGAAPQALCDITDFRGGAWGEKGDVLFSPDASEGLYRVADTGGPVTRVTSLDPAREDSSHRWPAFLPGGRRFLFFIVGQAQGIYLGSLDSKELKRLVDAVSAPTFAPPSHLLYVSRSSLVAQPIDPERGEVSGDPVAVAEGIWRDPSLWGLTAYSVSATGLLAYRPGSGAEMQFTWFDRTGKNLGGTGPLGTFSEPSFSPDEKKVAVARLDRDTGKQDIWVYDLTRGNAARLSFSATSSSGQAAVWSPDGASILYSSLRGSGWGIFRRPAAGGGAEEPVMPPQSGIEMYPDDLSRDGRLLIYERVDPKTKYDLWALDLQSQKAQPILVTEFSETHSQLSPDGQYLAYVSDETGHGEVYVQRIPGPGGRWPVSSGGGDQPRWRSDGKELFFVGPGRALMAVDVKVGPSGFEAGIPKELFSTGFPEPSGIGNRNSYVVADQGQRFLVTVSLEEASNIEVVVNWPAVLKPR